MIAALMFAYLAFAFEPMLEMHPVLAPLWFVDLAVLITAIVDVIRNG